MFADRAFRAFIFDLDGTLLDTLPDLVVVTNAALAACGYPERTTEEIKSFVGNGVKALMYQAVPEGTDEEHAEAAMRTWKEVHPVLEGKLTTPYPGIVETVEHLRSLGAKTAVLSNKYDEGVQHVMEQFMPGLFDVRHGECASIPRKPDPTGLVKTMGELGVDAELCAYIGDSPGDIVTAKAAGVLAVGVAWGYHNARDLADAGADIVISQAQDLLALM